MLQLWLNVIAGGVLIGFVYALIACGLTVVFGVMRVVNFAHGEMVVAGMYIGYWASALCHIAAVPAAVLAAVLMFAFGYGLQLVLIERFMTRSQHVQFILFIGLSLVLTGTFLMAFGPDPRAADSAVSFSTVTIGLVTLDLARFQAAASAAALVAALAMFLRFSAFGRALRAAADNRTGALVAGLNIPRVFAITMGLGAACAGAAGALISPMFDTQPFLAVDFTLVAFTVVIIGGLGSILGAVAGGLLIGVAEACAALLIEPSMKSAFSFALLVAVLILRPNGLFGEKLS